MANSRDQFEARVGDTHKRLRRLEDSLKELEADFHERPQESADALLISVPVQLEVLRNGALSQFGVDLEDHEQRRKLRWANLADALEYTLLAIKYDTLAYAWSLMQFVHTTEERGERLARLVCAAFLMAWKNMPGVIAATIEAYQKAVPHLANEAGLAEYLTGYLATHTSLRMNRRLRAGIAERQEEGETLFARLLKELPAEALTAYKEKPPAWGDLMDLRSEVARRLEKRSSSPKKAELVEAAEFASQEELVRLAKRLAKRANLSRQETEVFELWLSHPSISRREMATRLGMRSSNHVGVVRHRVKRKLEAAGF